MHPYSKSKVALADIALWADRWTKCHWNTIRPSHFHLIAPFVSGGEFFTGNYIQRHPQHSALFFDPQVATADSLFLSRSFQSTFYIL